MVSTAVAYIQMYCSAYRPTCRPTVEHPSLVTDRCSYTRRPKSYYAYIVYMQKIKNKIVAVYYVDSIHVLGSYYTDNYYTDK